MCHVKLRNDGRANQWSCSPHVLAATFICHDDPPHRRIKQQLNERNKQTAEPNRKKSCLQKHPPLAQDRFGSLTWSEVISAAGWRSGDGDEVKHGAEG